MFQLNLAKTRDFWAQHEQRGNPPKTTTPPCFQERIFPKFDFHVKIEAVILFWKLIQTKFTISIHLRVTQAKKEHRDLEFERRAQKIRAQGSIWQNCSNKSKMALSLLIFRLQAPILHPIRLSNGNSNFQITSVWPWTRLGVTKVKKVKFWKMLQMVWNAWRIDPTLKKRLQSAFFDIFLFFSISDQKSHWT